MGFLRKIGSSKSLREKASKDAYRPPTPPPQLPPLPDHIRRSESKSTEQSSTNTQQRAQRRRSRSLWATADEAKIARTGLQRRDSFCGSTFTTDSSPASQPWRSRDAWLALHTPTTPTIVNDLTFPCSLDPPTPGWRGRGGGGFFAGTESMTDAELIKSATRGEDGDSIYSLPPRSRSRAATLHSSGSPTPARSKLAYPTPPLEDSPDESPMSPTLMPKTGSRRPSHAGSQIEPPPPVPPLPAQATNSPAPSLPPTPTTPRAPARSNSVTTTARDSTSSGDHGSQSPVTPQQSTQLLQAPFVSNFLPSEAKVPWGQASRSASPILFRNDSTSTSSSSKQSLSARSSVRSSRAPVQHSPAPPQRALPATPPDSDSGHSDEAHHGLAYDQPRDSVDADEAGEVIDFTRPRSPAEPAEPAHGPLRPSRASTSVNAQRSRSSSRGRRGSIPSSYDTHDSFNSAAFYTPPAADSPNIASAVAQSFFAPALPVPSSSTTISAAASASTTTLPTTTSSLSRSAPRDGLVIPPPRSTSRPPSRTASRASRSSHGHSSHGHEPYTPATAQYPTPATLNQWRAGSVDSPSPAPMPQSPPLVSLQPQKTGGSLRSIRRSSHVSTHRSMKSAGKGEIPAEWNAVPDPFAGPWEQPAPYEIGFNPEHQPIPRPQKGVRLPSLRGSGRLAKAGWI